MRKIAVRILYPFLIAVFALLSCSEEEVIKPEMPRQNDQTLFMYMPWSSNLTSYFHNNIADFEKAIGQGILSNERVIVFFSTSPTEATMFELLYENGQCLRDTLKNFTNPPVTSAEGISSILTDVKTFAPANRYAMIISCHGMGWLPVTDTKTLRSGEAYHWENEGVPLTRFFGGLTSEYQTEVSTLAQGIKNAGIKMEYIMFDDCYMSTVEVAYDLKDVTRYLIASPTEVMAYGFPYADMGKYLVGEVNYQGISNSFYEFYSNYSQMPCGTIGVTDCSELENLASIMKEINNRYKFETDMTGSIQTMDGYTPVIFFDYADYVSKLCRDEALLAMFTEQFERTVPSDYKKHTPSYYTMTKGKIDIKRFSGITISDPSLHSLALSAKTETAWYRATH